MKIHNCTQGSREWMQLRAGRPTASQFGRIVTPTGKISTQASAYIYECLAELVMGRPLEGPKMPWMERGSSLEDEAARWYSLQTDTDLEKVGFCTNDEGTIGASPDRLIGEDGGLELKCPSPAQHMVYLLFPKKGVDKAYRPQVQGNLYVTGRKWWDICSYHGELPSVIVRVERDEDYIALLDSTLKEFCKQLEDLKLLAEQRGLFNKAEPRTYDFVSDDDVSEMIRRGLIKPENKGEEL